MSQLQYTQTVQAEQEWTNEAGQTREEADTWFEAEKAEMLAEYEAIESAFGGGKLDKEYAEWLMEPGRHRICNGHDLVEAMENQDNADAFLRHKAQL